MNQFSSRALREGLGHEGKSFSIPKHVKDNEIMQKDSHQSSAARREPWA